MRAHGCTGYFASLPRQPGCISCDNLGDYYQELGAQSACLLCPTQTVRHLGVLTAANKSACMCKEGTYPVTAAVRVALRDWSIRCCRILEARWATWTPMLSVPTGRHLQGSAVEPSEPLDRIYALSGRCVASGRSRTSLSSPWLLGSHRSAKQDTGSRRVGSSRT